MLALSIFKFAEIGWYTVSYNSVQVCGTNSEGNKVSKILTAALILNFRYKGLNQCQELHVLLLTTGELTVELHIGVSGIYNVRSSVLSYPFYIIAYTLDNIFRSACYYGSVTYLFLIILCLHSIHPPLGDYQWDCMLKHHALLHRYVPYCEGKQSNLVSSNVDSFLSWNPNMDPLLQ